MCLSDVRDTSEKEKSGKQASDRAAQERKVKQIDATLLDAGGIEEEERKRRSS